MYALQEELSDTKERNIQLASRLQQKEADLDEARKTIGILTKEKEQLREKVSDMEEEKLHFSDFMQLAVYILYNETNLPLMHHIKI